MQLQQEQALLELQEFEKELACSSIWDEKVSFEMDTLNFLILFDKSISFQNTSSTDSKCQE